MSYRDDLFQSYKNGNFLETVYSCYLTDSEDFSVLVKEMVAMHNEGIIDVVEAFALLKNDTANSQIFFRTRTLIEKVLPELDAPMSSVMRCILRLYKEAGQDYLAHTIINSFIEFCKKNSSRPREAIVEVELHPDKFAVLLVASLIAGFDLEPSFYLEQAIRLCKDLNIELRRQAIFSLGVFVWPDGKTLSDSAIISLKCSVTVETDDQILAVIVKSAFSFLKKQKDYELRVIKLIQIALSKGQELTLHAASEIFGFETEKLNDSLLVDLLVYLRRVKPENKSTLNNIDFGIGYLLKNGEEGKAIQLLEELLLAHPDELNMEIFDSASREILNNNAIVSKVVTRWFQRGDRVLCEGVHTIINLHDGNDLSLEIDSDELKNEDIKNILFVARKAIGYLFIQPISAASILISLIQNTSDDEIAIELGRLLFNPLLLNYTGNLREYLIKKSEQDSGKVKETIKEALKSIENYLEGLQSVGNLAALHPGEKQREAYNRHFSLSMRETRKAVEVRSVFVNLFPKSVLLYGRKAIDYVYGVDGQTQRVEIPLKTFGTDIEIPRMEYLDPFSLAFMLRFSRFEKLKP